VCMNREIGTKIGATLGSSGGGCGRNGRWSWVGSLPGHQGPPGLDKTIGYIGTHTQPQWEICLGDLQIREVTPILLYVWTNLPCTTELHRQRRSPVK